MDFSRQARFKRDLFYFLQEAFLLAGDKPQVAITPPTNSFKVALSFAAPQPFTSSCSADLFSSAIWRRGVASACGLTLKTIRCD